MGLGVITVGSTVFKPGETAEIKFYLSPAAPAGAKWYLYDPVTGWQDYSKLATFSPDRKTVTVNLMDWGFGDADGIPNGVILDPGGFGYGSILTGLVNDSLAMQNINAALVTISLADASLSLATDVGSYNSLIIPGEYTVSVSADGYEPINNAPLTVLAQAGTYTHDFSLTPKVDIPAYSLAGGTYHYTQAVEITGAMTGATIRYTTRWVRTDRVILSVLRPYNHLLDYHDQGKGFL